MFLDKIDHAPVMNCQFSPSHYKISPRFSPSLAKAQLSFITHKLPKLPINSSPKNISYLSLITTPNNKAPGSISLVNPPEKMLLNLEDLPAKKISKSQPKVSKNLPAVFINSANQKIKIKRVPSRRNIENTADPSLQLSHLQKLEPLRDDLLSSRKQRMSKSRNYISPLRMMLSPNNNNQSEIQRVSGTPKEQDSIIERKLFTRQEKIDKEGHKIRKLIIFKKFQSKSPDPKNFETEPSIVMHYTPKKEELRVKLLDMFDKIPQLQLNEFITLKKVKTTMNNGVLKRMLHVPSFRIYDILEEPLFELRAKENLVLRDWINLWKSGFDPSKNIMKVYSCFWNSPEGCLSTLMEPAKRSFLSDLLGNVGNLPESCVQSVARDVLKGLNEIHKKIKGPHGAVMPSELAIDAKGKIKLAPGISTRLSTHFKPNPLLLHRYDSDHPPSHRQTPLNSHRHLSYQPDLASKFADLSPAFSSRQDIFDLGLTLLSCALGPLDLLDSTIFNPDTLHTLIDNILSKKQTKNYCCLLHSESQLRKLAGTFIFPPTSAGNQPGARPSPMNNYFHSPKASPRSKSRVERPLLTRLTEQNRFSESFVDFLCSCLKIDPEQRVMSDVLLSHEFLSETHANLGPCVSIVEIMATCQGYVGQGKEFAERMANQQVEKFCEALKVVFMNREVKEKFDEMVKRTPGNVVEERKMLELAGELDVGVGRIWEGMKRGVLGGAVRSMVNVEEGVSVGYGGRVEGRVGTGRKRNFSAQPNRIGF